MSNPTITCTACDKTRDCMLHTRAEHPPTAARAWLRKHCKHGAPKPCEFTYRPGGL